MESSSSSTTFGPSNSSSQTLHHYVHQNSPPKQSFSFSSNDFSNEEISNKMSLHLHSTTRRVFIGPTPTNWSYKKNSLFFSKSDYAKSINKRQSRTSSILSNGIISKREKQDTFIASRDSTGPMNLSSLNYEIISKRNSVEIFTNPKDLVSEPQDLELSGPSNEVFYTPTVNINTNPITPPNLKHDQTYFPSPLKLEENEPSVSTSQGGLLSSIEKDNDEEKSNAKSERSRKFDEEPIVQENDNMNHGPPPLIEIDNDKPKCVRFSSSVATTKSQTESNTIIKQDPMLVRIDCEEVDTEELLSKKLKRYFNKSEDWREYMVKLKPDVIELYKRKNQIADRIYFTAKTKVSMLSSSDYTILITQPVKYCTKNLILNPKTTSLSIEWYQALYELMPESMTKSIPCSLEVIIPDLDVKLQIPLYNTNDEEGGGCECNEDEQKPSLMKVNAAEVMNDILNELSDITEWDDVLNNWVKSNNLRLCWKRYERLEWIALEGDGTNKECVWDDLIKCPQFVEQTHQLQLRPMEHYPTTIKLNDGTKLTEPPPIEGYLIKVTNNKGQNRKLKRLYFTSQNNYLFFLGPLKTSPPPPPNVSTSTTDNDGIQLCDNTRQHPLIYAISPYIQDKIVGNDNTFMKSDIKRRVKQILHAIGFIDLTEVVEIKCLKNDGKSEENLEEGLDDDDEVNDEKGCPFQLLLKNDGIVTLKAYSKQTRKEWVNHLNELVKYWKARLIQDAKIKIDMIKTNQSIYRRNHNVHDALRNWENFKSYADPILWNWCILDGCRGIIKSGLLYQRTHIRQPFQNYHHILTRGHFLYFNHCVRSTLSGCVSSRSYHKHKGIINLRDCYVYSGSITEHEYYNSNLLQEQSIAKTHNNQLGKIYGDGMLSFDDYKDSSFVIWQSERKYYFNNDGMKINAEKRIKFGIPGNYWIFRAKNKIECEEWVWALNVEIERLYNEENENK